MKPAHSSPAADVEAYIREFPEPVCGLLQNVRRIIRKALPDAAEGIKYGIPTYSMSQNLVHFAGYKNHIGFYPSPLAIEHFKDALSGYKTSKGAIQFPLDQPIPYTLIEEITRYRLQQLQGSVRN